VEGPDKRQDPRDREGAGVKLGLLGGTFDPVHTGHLDVAGAARQALGLDEVWLLPARVPPHRTQGPWASGYHRFAMVALAVLDRPGLLASDFELRGQAPSYTGATLNRLQALGHDPLQLFFISGADAFADIATWRDYPALLDRANFVAVSRPGHAAAALRDRLPDLAPRMISVEPGRAPASGRPAIFLIECPTTDVSSTGIRARIRDGATLGGLVPALVERHIRRHHLYSPLAPAADDLHG
jgi:nicotinate-nucleotide adenylyltransferase